MSSAFRGGAIESDLYIDKLKELLTLYNSLKSKNKLKLIDDSWMDKVDIRISDIISDMQRISLDKIDTTNATPQFIEQLENARQELKEV